MPRDDRLMVQIYVARDDFIELSVLAVPVYWADTNALMITQTDLDVFTRRVKHYTY